MQFYSDPEREKDPFALSDMEVFFMGEEDLFSYMTDGGTVWNDLFDMPEDSSEEEIREQAKYSEGWYYWTCFPGCLPDSAPEGPFASEDGAIADAREMV
jgi:hypothetical protein